MSITIEIRGVNGSGKVTFAADWLRLSPCGQVLAIHDALRHVTAGRPFEIVKERRA